MATQFYQVNIIPGEPDQELTTSLNGTALILRLYFASTTNNWWLAVSNADKSVTLSHICLKPGVLHSLNGKLPGYGGVGEIGVARLRANVKFGDINAFDGAFGLFFYDDVGE
ncbi:hypothetical protein [Kosakonia sacchari]|uniref:hypothetical protein n=1 Tax=Kosakonia sacchari TaxID=1158459 RepID=UPI0015845DB8|nr:hypothetical protein [Kosakonia sacchari]NUL35036.1 hypothetical protein [Kosakonia sacchari]